MPAPLRVSAVCPGEDNTSCRLPFPGCPGSSQSYFRQFFHAVAPRLFYQGTLPLYAVPNGFSCYFLRKTWQELRAADAARERPGAGFLSDRSEGRRPVLRLAFPSDASPTRGGRRPCRWALDREHGRPGGPAATRSLRRSVESSQDDFPATLAAICAVWRPW